MSSGFGYNGGTSRCFNEWQRFLECYTSAETTKRVQCTPQADDYFECLHHRKEKARTLAIKTQLDKNKEKAEKAGEEFTPVVVNANSLPEALGLIEK